MNPTVNSIPQHINKFTSNIHESFKRPVELLIAKDKEKSLVHKAKKLVKNIRPEQLKPPIIVKYGTAMTVDGTSPGFYKIKHLHNKLFSFLHWNINKSNSINDFSFINAYITSLGVDIVSLNETNHTSKNDSLNDTFPNFHIFEKHRESTYPGEGVMFLVNKKHNCININLEFPEFMTLKGEHIL